MSRRRAAEKRKVLPDAKFGNEVATKFINCMMVSGKKSVSESIFYQALELLSKNVKQPPMESFMESIENIKPAIEVRSRRVGGATYQVPSEVRPDRRLALSIKWIIAAARKRNETTMVLKLAGELSDAFNKRGAAFKKREDTHKMADANKAFSHFRW